VVLAEGDDVDTQRRVEVGPVQVAVRGAELGREPTGVRSPLQLAAVGCAADEIAQRFPGLPGQGRAYPEEVKGAHRVRRDGDPTPISRSARACSKTRIGTPKCWSDRAAVRPPIPAR
jgi:hypothetical protein